MADSRAAEVLEGYDRLKGARGTWENHWQEVAERVWPQLESLESAQSQAVERLRAVALAATGKHSEALVALSDLARRYPNDSLIQESFG